MKRKWLFPAALVLIAAGAFIFRLPKLDFRPMHGDEAVQADKFRKMWEEHEWIYDPLEYHGPTLNYFTAIPMWLTRAKDFAHSTEFTYRIVPVCFGAGLILLMLLTADGLGRRSTLCAAILLAISPAMVFYSRYYIQEMLLVFFTYAAIGFGWQFFRTAKVYHAILCGIALGLAFASKETWILSLFSAIFAIAAALGWSRLLDPRLPADAQPQLKIRKHPSRILPALLACCLAALFISAVCFSAFFTHPKGIPDSFATYLNYLHRGTASGGHEHPFNYYFRVLFYWTFGKYTFSEGFIAALAIIGIISSLWKRGQTLGGYYNSFTGQLHASHPALVRFLSFYTLCITFLYSALRYKTPWCAINFLFPMILLAGVGAVSFVQMTRSRYAKPLVALLLLIPAANLANQAYRMNFDRKFVADARLNPHVYGHPLFSMPERALKIRSMTKFAPRGDGMLVCIISPEHDWWPYPWYLRELPHIGYFDSVQQMAQSLPAGLNPAVIIISDPQLVSGENRDFLFVPLDQHFDGKLDQLYQIYYDNFRSGAPVGVAIRRDIYRAYQASLASK